MDKVVHFEVPADDLARAQKFYEEAFGWKVNLVPEFNYALVTTGPTPENSGPTEPGFINGGMLKRQEPVKNPVITIGVENVDEAMEKIKKAGGKMVSEKIPVGEMGFSAYFTDSEGNTGGIFEEVKK